MGILVICSYRPKPGHEEEARQLMQGHVPLLRRHDLITGRAVFQGVGQEGELVEIFEWESREKSRGAPALPEIGAHWKAMSAVMDFVPLAQLPEAQHAFAHFNPIG
jgi:quinol monooxygenase YgiN